MSTGCSALMPAEGSRAVRGTEPGGRGPPPGASGVGAAQGVADLAPELGEGGIEAQVVRAGVRNGTSNDCRIRPGRADITSTRVERKTASVIEWVMNRAPKPLRCEQGQQLVVEPLAGDLVERRRTARRTGRPRGPSPARGPARPASASRPRAAAGTCPRSRRARRARSFSATRGPDRPRASRRARRRARHCGAPCATAAAWRPGRRSRGCRGRR